jgi:hypothetical protein
MFTIEYKCKATLPSTQSTTIACVVDEAAQILPHINRVLPRIPYPPSHGLVEVNCAPIGH